MTVQLAIDSVTNDIVFENGILQLVSGQEAVRDELTIRLQTHKGEWFLDSRIGVPYRELILIRNPNLSVVSSILRDEILKQDGIISIIDFDVNLVSSSRKFEISGTLKTDVGVVVITSNPDDIPDTSSDDMMPVWLITILGVT